MHRTKSSVNRPCVRQLHRSTASYRAWKSWAADSSAIPTLPPDRVFDRANRTANIAAGTMIAFHRARPRFRSRPPGISSCFRLRRMSTRSRHRSYPPRLLPANRMDRARRGISSIGSCKSAVRTEETICLRVGTSWWVIRGVEVRGMSDLLRGEANGEWFVDGYDLDPIVWSFSWPNRKKIQGRSTASWLPQM